MKGVKYSDRYLKKQGLDRDWVQSWGSKWVPGFTPFNDDSSYSDAIKEIQRFVYGDEGDKALGVDPEPATASEADGYLGPGTHRRMLTYQKFEEAENADQRLHEELGLELVDYVVWKGQRIPVNGVHVVSFDEPGGLNFHDKKTYPWPGEIGDLIKTSGKYATHLGTDHWDAGFSAAGAFRVLCRLGYYTTMGIDNPSKEDGKVVVYQWSDPGLVRGVHGGGTANRRSVLSTDYSNAVYLKYASKYEERCGIPRPKVLMRFHGRKKWALGMYKEQIIAGMRMKKAFSEITGLPFVYPTDDDGRPWTKVVKGLWYKNASMVHQHLNITARKWDCGALMEQTIVLLLEDPKLMEEFPSLVECFRLHDDGWAEWLDNIKSTWTWGEVWG